MLLLLNVSVEPFFIALLKKEGTPFAQAFIPNTKQAGEEMFRFCEKYQEHFSTLLWAGTVTGPGGFTTLRLGASLVNTLHFVQGTPLRTVTAMEWVSDWLQLTSYQKALLNSFGETVFLVENNNHRLISLHEVRDLKDVWYGGLPEAKRKSIGLKNQKETIDVESLYKICIQKEEQQEVVPEYYFEAVKTEDPSG